MQRLFNGRFLFTFLVLSGLLISCAHVVPKEIRKDIDKNLTPQMVFKDPESYRGCIVMLGGLILATAHTKDATYIEVLERPLDIRGRPEDRDLSRGRFTIRYDGYLDPAIYTKGKLITAVGELSGTKPGKIGEMEYRYPLIVSKNIYLFEKPKDIPIRFGIGIFKSF